MLPSLKIKSAVTRLADFAPQIVYRILLHLGENGYDDDKQHQKDVAYLERGEKIRHSTITLSDTLPR